MTLGEEPGVGRQESGELIMSINQLNALFRYFMQFYAFFFSFLNSQKLIMQELYTPTDNW
ncbi:MAG: hypothetical protein EWV42_00375 [Microcystis panniformis Mp_GB_SS_20050300_S99D]|nr:MAG: hypothetical protein EWV43_05465 [Microcystis panniformis Mp_MB_F_20080800_S26D]TRV56027.1 MAG: hypothetical protein EWV42_00375 [Microcystis panniformis Mp_GB_SS_20050300_S99D]TRV75104.1 MAG: hypothetical protein EWV51_09620 [Microcystis panniformis Mp_MB_F_20051200_S6]